MRIHLCDIIEKSDGTVYGDGVNIAARLQSLADAGGVMVSDQYERAVEISRSALRVPNCQYWANAHLTAALGHLNPKAEARAALDELMTRKPGFTVGYAKDHLFYIEDARQLDGYLDGLRKAGVPD